MPLSTSLRLAVVCFMAVAIGLGMAVISLAKVALVLCGLLMLLAVSLSRKPLQPAMPADLWAPAAIALALAGMALTLAWTSAPLDDALKAFAKHAKLIMIPLLIWLVRSRREARLALACYAAVQLLVLLSSWLLVLDLPVPWSTREHTPDEKYSVFATHLDQPIMLSTFAALCWQLRGEIPGRYGRWLMLGVVALALGHLLLFTQGRTGQVVGIGLLSLAVYWEIPRRYRLAGLAAPVAVALLFVLGASPTVRDRLLLIGSEVHEYAQQSPAATEVDTSSGQRLNFWHRSLQAAAERPLFGHGVGSWNLEYNRLEGGKARSGTDGVRNPHQEFLLWLVEGGAMGLLLLLGVVAALLRDSLRLPQQASRAAVSALAALVLACLFNSSLYDGAIGDYLCVVMGLTLALGLRERAESHGAA